jgi:hypothetical protein
MIKDFENGNKFIDLQNWTLCPLCQKQIPLLLPFWDNNGKVQILILCQCQQETKNKKWKEYLFPSPKISQNDRIKIAIEIKKLLNDYKFNKKNNIITLDEYIKKLNEINKKEKKCCIHNTSHNCLYCVQCGKYFCEECRIIHNELSINHIFITRELTFFQECPKHKNKKLKIYNLDKLKRYCKLCIKEKLEKKQNKKVELKKSENEISQLFNDEGIKNDQVKIDELNHKFSQIIYVLYNLDQEINKLKEQFKNLDNGNQEYEKLEKELKSSNIETYNDYYNQIKPFLEKQKKANVKKPDIKEKTIKINNSLLFYIKMCYENFEKSKGFFSSYIIQNLKFMTKLNPNIDNDKTISRTVFIENTYCQFFQKHLSNGIKCHRIFLINEGICIVCDKKIIIITNLISKEFEISNQEITSVAIDNNYLLFGGKQKKKYYVNVIDLKTNKKVYLPSHSDDITHIVPCGDFMFSTGSKDKIIHHYNYKDFKIDCKYTMYEDKPISGLIYINSPINSNILLVASGNKVSYNIIGSPLEKKQYNLHYLNINSMILTSINNKQYLMTSGEDGFIRNFLIEHADKKFKFVSGIFINYPIANIYNYYDEYIICKLNNDEFRFVEYNPNKNDKMFDLCNLNNLYSNETNYEIKDMVPFKNKLMCIQKKKNDTDCVDILFKQSIKREKVNNFISKEVLFVN